MEILLSRRWPNKFSITGSFTCANFSCFSMELPLEYNGMANVKDKCCVPADTYSVERLFSAHFNRMMPHIVGVPGRTEIEIHYGSKPSNILGCTSLGNVRYSDNPQSADDIVLTETREAFEEFDKLFEQALANGEQVTIEITNDF